MSHRLKKETKFLERLCGSVLASEILYGLNTVLVKATTERGLFSVRSLKLTINNFFEYEIGEELNAKNAQEA